MIVTRYAYIRLEEIFAVKCGNAIMLPGHNSKFGIGMKIGVASEILFMSSWIRLEEIKLIRNICTEGGKNS